MDLIERLIQLGEEREHLQEYLRPILEELQNEEPPQKKRWYEVDSEDQAEYPGHGEDPVPDAGDQDVAFLAPPNTNLHQEDFL